MSKSTVYRVDDVTVFLTKSDPPQFMITARGTVLTQGWSKPELTPYVYLMPPADGIQDFGFIAAPPAGIVPQVLTPIVATYTIDPLSEQGVGTSPQGVGTSPVWVRGVRVHASSNTIRKRPSLAKYQVAEGFSSRAPSRMRASNVRPSAPRAASFTRWSVT